MNNNNTTGILIDAYTRYKYSPIGDFRPRTLKPDLKGCFVWFIAFLLITGIIVGLSILFGK